MEYILVFFVALLGLVSGSFLNVVIFRLPAGKSVIQPRSHCPHCGYFLRAWELIPVLSYLLLLGRCSKCLRRISWRYPVVEMLTALLFIFTYLLLTERTLFGLALDFIFISLLVALTFIDIDTYRLPDRLVVLVALIGLINALTTGKPPVGQSLLGAAFAGAFFFLIAYIYPQGMGFGDVKFVTALGLYLGMPQILGAVFLASLLGTIIGGLWLKLTKKNLKNPIPFGPFLAAGALLVIFFQKQLLELCNFIL
jgi:leader peptidase (prepilin peptidase)/N-methyltransferase